MAERKYPIEEYKKEVYKLFPEYDKTYIDNVLSEMHSQWNEEFYYFTDPNITKKFRDDELKFRDDDEISKDEFIKKIKKLKGEFINVYNSYDSYDTIDGFIVESYDLHSPTLEEVVKDSYKYFKLILDRPYDEISAMEKNLKAAKEKLEKLTNKTQGK